MELRRNGIPHIVLSPSSYRTLGIVRQGMSFGILAFDANERYVRINGSYIEPLSTDSVESAIRRLLKQCPELIGSLRKSMGQPTWQPPPRPPERKFAPNNFVVHTSMPVTTLVVVRQVPSTKTSVHDQHAYVSSKPKRTVLGLRGHLS